MIQEENTGVEFVGTVEVLPEEGKEIELPAEEEKLEFFTKQENIFFRPIEASEETRVQYAKVGLDIHTFQRFKQLAASLVLEKEVAMARTRSCALGNEKDVLMEESIECVPKNFLEEIEGDAFTVDTIRVLSVGELLSLLEV